MSDEAFRLDASLAICMLMDALRCLSNPENKIAEAALMENYKLQMTNDEQSGFIIATPLPETFSSRRETLRLMALYELLEELFSIFTMSCIEKQDAYLFSFFDAVTEYLQSNSSELDSFIRYWDETLCSKTIPSGEMDGIRILSIHKSKGLEFPVVFLCGMNEGIFPSRKTRTKRGKEEERRLAFVPMTRAEDELYLTEAEGTNLDGTPRFPSRFILDIDRKYLSFDPPVNESLWKAGKAYVERTSAYLKDEGDKGHFPVGCRVRHTVFGMGTIEEVDEKNNSYRIRFDSMDTTRDIAFRARLVKVD